MSTLLQSSPASRPVARFLTPLLGVAPAPSPPPALARAAAAVAAGIGAHPRALPGDLPRAGRRGWRALVPAPLTDRRAARGQGFVSVCALDIDDMGIVGLAVAGCASTNRELLYRVGRPRRRRAVVLHAAQRRQRAGAGAAGPVSRTTGSASAQVSAAARDGRFRLDVPVARRRRRRRLRGGARRGRRRRRTRCSPTPRRPARFLLGMRFSVDVRARRAGARAGRSTTTRGARASSTPTRRRFDFLEALGTRDRRARCVYDHTLVMTRPATDLEGRAMDLTPRPPPRTTAAALAEPLRAAAAGAHASGHRARDRPRAAVLLYCSARAFGKSYCPGVLLLALLRRRDRRPAQAAAADPEQPVHAARRAGPRRRRRSGKASSASCSRCRSSCPRRSWARSAGRRSGATSTIAGAASAPRVAAGPGRRGLAGHRRPARRSSPPPAAPRRHRRR